MVSKRLSGHYLRSCEQIKKNRILTNKSHFPCERFDIFLMKKASLPLRNLVIFSKKWYQKTLISLAKTLKKFKNIESLKMVLKRLYGHYLRSYEQIKKNRILTTKSHFPHGIGSKISWWKRRLCAPETCWFFQKNGIKKQRFQKQKHSKSSKILKVQKWCQNGSTAII